MAQNEHVVKLQGKEYLTVAGRIIAFRADFPPNAERVGRIYSELVSVADGVVVARAEVWVGDTCIASNYGTAPLAGKGSYAGRGVEKAVTAAIGRALALAGYGQAEDDDLPDHLADAPLPPSAPTKPAPAHWATDEVLAKAAKYAADNGLIFAADVGTLRASYDWGLFATKEAYLAALKEAIAAKKGGS